MDGHLHPAEAIRELARLAPERQVRTGDGQWVGAIWNHAPIEVVVPGLTQHAVALHLGGDTRVEKWSDGRLIGHRSRIGSLTLVPADRCSGWVIAGTARVAHLYVDPARLRALDPAGGSATLQDFFAEDDPVLAALVRLALALAQPGGAVDALARDQVDLLVARHLLARYRLDAARAKPLARPLSLSGPALRRVLDHVDAHLDRDLRLSELATLAHLSEDHFLRAFKRSVGQTPHQYLIGCRLARARRLLADGRLPLAEVGRRCGFRNASHFAATFHRHEGMPPGAWARSR